MTLTFNTLAVLQFIFILAWLFFAGFITATMESAEIDAHIFTAIVWILCGGSAAMLYFGR